ncbi:MAG: thioredoxin family protein [Novosphingobium sp.]
MLRVSRQLNYGAPAPDFALPDTAGRVRTLAEFADAPALLVAFICNHCPFVLHVIDEVVAIAREYRAKGLQVVAISSNYPDEYPEDDYPHMQAFARERDLPFPYLHDERQDVALAYNAICTPDFFLYDGERRLYYAGQLDPSRPKIDRPPVPGMPPLRTDLPVTGEDMRRALDALLAGEPAPQPQAPSAGCSIKWRPGNDPSWG